MITPAPDDCDPGERTSVGVTAKPRTQPSCRRRPDDCIARMMRKPNRARSTSDAALLLLKRIGLLVRHGHSNGGGRFLHPGAVVDLPTAAHLRSP